MGIDVRQTPGLDEAADKERLIRDSAFLCRTQTVCGFELVPMTLRHYTILRHAANPLLFGGVPSPAELGAFLWLLSPDYSPCAKNRKKWLRRHIRPFYPPDVPRLRLGPFMRKYEASCERVMKRAQPLIKAIWDYIDETMFDRPKPGKKSGYHPSYYSDIVFWWKALGSNGFHCSWQEVLDMPLKILWQCLNAIKEANGKACYNPLQSEAMSKHAETLNACLKRK